MRLIKMFGLAVLAAVIAAALISAIPASASTVTQLCDEHIDLECPEWAPTALVHTVLVPGTVLRILSSLVTILCLGALLHLTPLKLDQPQQVHSLSSEYTGCGTGSAHSNCTITVEEEPLANLLKLGLDTGSLTLTSGRVRARCSNLGLDCVFDLAGILLTVSAQHFTANNAPVSELGGKFFCPDEGKIDRLLETLEDTYVLQ